MTVLYLHALKKEVLSKNEVFFNNFELKKILKIEFLSKLKILIFNCL